MTNTKFGTTLKYWISKQAGIRILTFIQRMNIDSE